MLPAARSASCCIQPGFLSPCQLRAAAGSPVTRDSPELCFDPMEIGSGSGSAHGCSSASLGEMKMPVPSQGWLQ